MKKLSLVATVSGVLVAAPLWAEETQKTDTTNQQRIHNDSQLQKSEAKTTPDPGSTDSTTMEKEKTEKTPKYNPGGLRKSKVKDKTATDSQGNLPEKAPEK